MTRSLHAKILTQILEPLSQLWLARSPGHAQAMDVKIERLGVRGLASEETWHIDD